MHLGRCEQPDGDGAASDTVADEQPSLAAQRELAGMIPSVRAAARDEQRRAPRQYDLSPVGMSTECEIKRPLGHRSEALRRVHQDDGRAVVRSRTLWTYPRG